MSFPPPFNVFLTAEGNRLCFNAKEPSPFGGGSLDHNDRYWLRTIRGMMPTGVTAS
jgi:hypothetical protein